MFEYLSATNTLAPAVTARDQFHTAPAPVTSVPIVLPIGDVVGLSLSAKGGSGPSSTPASSSFSSNSSSSTSSTTAAPVLRLGLSRYRLSVAEERDVERLPCRNSCRARERTTSPLQIGHVRRRVVSQGVIHSTWNSWPQGRDMTRLMPSTYSSKHTTHSRCLPPYRRRHSANPFSRCSLSVRLSASSLSSSDDTVTPMVGIIGEYEGSGW
jgi:hypothetical protein